MKNGDAPSTEVENLQSSWSRNEPLFIYGLSGALIVFAIGIIAVESHGNLIISVSMFICGDVGLFFFTLFLARANLEASERLYKARIKIWAEILSALSIVVVFAVLLFTVITATKAFDDVGKAVGKVQTFPVEFPVEKFVSGPHLPRTMVLQKGDQLTLSVPVKISVPSERDGFVFLTTMLALPFACIAAGLKIALAFAESKQRKQSSTVAPSAPITPALSAIAPSQVTPHIPVRTSTPVPVNGAVNGASSILILAFIAFGVLGLTRPTREPQAGKTKKW